MFHIVFFEPRIPANTGNAIRMVACTGATLHLVEPITFDLSDAKLRRAGLDYHDLANVRTHATWEEQVHWLNTHASGRIFAFTTAASTLFTDVAFQPGDALLFGPEPTGLPDEITAHPAITKEVTIPMLSGRRSLNLSNSAAIGAYEAWRQHGFQDWQPRSDQA